MGGIPSTGDVLPGTNIVGVLDGTQLPSDNGLFVLGQTKEPKGLPFFALVILKTVQSPSNHNFSGGNVLLSIPETIIQITLKSKGKLERKGE